MFVRSDPKRNLGEVRIANADGTGEQLVSAINQAGGIPRSGGSWSPNGRTLGVAIEFWSSEQNGSAPEIISLADGAKHPCTPIPMKSGVLCGCQEGMRSWWNWQTALREASVGRSPYPQGVAHRVTNDLEF